MRIRTIKPEFFHHEGLFEAELETKLPLRVAFAGLWCIADREGRFKWEPRRIGVQVLPYDGVDFSRVLDALATRAFVLKYRVGDACFGWIPSFLKHQVINNRESQSILPDPEGNIEETPINTEEIDACTTRAPRDDHAGQGEGKGREGNGKEGVSQKALSPDLEAFRLRIGAMVRRRHDTRWSSKEIKALKEVFELNTPEDDILLVEARYKSKDPYLRRDAMALLNNWNGEVDKVRSGLLPGIGESRVAATSTNIEDYQ
jgi:hypothetical protein